MPAQIDASKYPAIVGFMVIGDTASLDFALKLAGPMVNAGGGWIMPEAALDRLEPFAAAVAELKRPAAEQRARNFQAERDRRGG